VPARTPLGACTQAELPRIEGAALIPANVRIPNL
jgi:hypothetical protein